MPMTAKKKKAKKAPAKKKAKKREAQEEISCVDPINVDVTVLPFPT